MTIKICDRCGKQLIEPGKRYSVSFAVYRVGRTKYDLCPECAEMIEKEVKGEENGER